MPCVTASNICSSTLTVLAYSTSLTGPPSSTGVIVIPMDIKFLWLATVRSTDPIVTWSLIFHISYVSQTTSANCSWRSLSIRHLQGSKCYIDIKISMNPVTNYVQVKLTHPRENHLQGWLGSDETLYHLTCCELGSVEMRRLGSSLLRAFSACSKSIIDYQLIRYCKGWLKPCCSTAEYGSIVRKKTGSGASSPLSKLLPLATPPFLSSTSTALATSVEATKTSPVYV